MELNGSADYSAAVDVSSLNTLPLEALLNIKRHVFSDETNATTKELDPLALPLHSNQKYFKTQEDLFHHDADEKSINVTKVFQLSVTSLAFLAFGGYLLFLIVAAIKGKHYNNYVYDPNATQIMQAMINAQLNKHKKKIKKKKRRPIKGQFGYKEDPMEHVRVRRDIMLDETLYQALLNLCEGYNNKIVT